MEARTARGAIMIGTACGKQHTRRPDGIRRAQNRPHIGRICHVLQSGNHALPGKGLFRLTRADSSNGALRRLYLAYRFHHRLRKRR